MIEEHRNAQGYDSSREMMSGAVSPNIGEVSVQYPVVTIIPVDPKVPIEQIRWAIIANRDGIQCQLILRIFSRQPLEVPAVF